MKYGGVVKGQRKILIVPDDPNAEPREYSIPRGVHVNVQEGDRVRAGDPLMDGPSNPHDILHVLGEKELQKYLVNEIQEVYRLQGVNINDKHIEVITRQMMRWVRVEDVGDTEFLIDEQVDKFRFMEENERVIGNGGRPATAQPLLLGITKASLSTESFISAASFQETTRVLTEAAISGKIDYLRGLKENVTMGRLIPAGTGFWWYRHVQIPADEPPPPPPVQQPSDDELELDREMEYLVEPEEALEAGALPKSNNARRAPLYGVPSQRTGSRRNEGHGDELVSVPFLFVVGSQVAKERAHVVDQQLRLFERGEVAAPRHRRPARDVVAAFEPAPRRPDDLLREIGARRRHLDAPAGRRRRRRVPALVVDARRRGRRLRHPVERDVGQQFVLGEHRFRIAVAVAPGAELLDDPGGEADRRIVQRDADGLRLGALDLLVAGLLGLEHLPHLQPLALARR